MPVVVSAVAVDELGVAAPVVLTAVRDVTFLDERAGTGFASFVVAGDDPQFLARPDLFSPDRSIVTFTTNGTDAFDAIVVQLDETTADDAGNTDWLVSCDAIRTLHDHVTVLQPDDSIDVHAEVRPWHAGAVEYLEARDPWAAPVALADQGDEAYERFPSPSNGDGEGEAWPDRDAAWIWGRLNTGNSPIPPAVNHFRSELTLTEPMDVAIAATADDVFELWVGGLEVLSDGGPRRHRQFAATTVTLSAGTYPVYAKAANTVQPYGDSAAAFLATFYEAGSGTSAIQHVVVEGFDSGTFTLTFGPPDGGPVETTEPIRANASASSVQEALRALPSIGQDGVAVGGTGTGTDPYAVRFAGRNAFRPIAALVVNDVDLSDDDASGTNIAQSTVRPGVANTVLLHTDSSNWVCLDDPAVPPAMTPGDVVLALAGEAAARGITAAGEWTFTFTATLDSAGNPWTVPADFDTPVGDTLTDVLDALADLGVRSRVSTGFVVDLFDPTTPLTVSGVTVEPGRNVRSVAGMQSGRRATALTVIYAGGVKTVEDAAGIAAFGRRERLLDLGGVTSPTQARRIAEQVLATQARGEATGVYGLAPEPGEEPYADFAPGETVVGPTLAGRNVHPVASITYVQDDDAGNDGWTVEIGDDVQVREDLLVAQTSRAARGTLAGRSTALARPAGGGGASSRSAVSTQSGRPSDVARTVRVTSSRPITTGGGGPSTAAIGTVTALYGDGTADVNASGTEILRAPVLEPDGVRIGQTVGVVPVGDPVTSWFVVGPVVARQGTVPIGVSPMVPAGYPWSELETADFPDGTVSNVATDPTGSLGEGLHAIAGISQTTDGVIVWNPVTGSVAAGGTDGRSLVGVLGVLDGDVIVLTTSNTELSRWNPTDGWRHDIPATLSAETNRVDTFSTSFVDASIGAGWSVYTNSQRVLRWTKAGAHEVMAGGYVGNIALAVGPPGVDVVASAWYDNSPAGIYVTFTTKSATTTAESTQITLASGVSLRTVAGAAITANGDIVVVALTTNATDPVVFVVDPTTGTVRSTTALPVPVNDNRWFFSGGGTADPDDPDAVRLAGMIPARELLDDVPPQFDDVNCPALFRLHGLNDDPPGSITVDAPLVLEQFQRRSAARNGFISHVHFTGGGEAWASGEFDVNTDAPGALPDSKYVTAVDAFTDALLGAPASPYSPPERGTPWNLAEDPRLADGQASDGLDAYVEHVAVAVTEAATGWPDGTIVTMNDIAPSGVLFVPPGDAPFVVSPPGSKSTGGTNTFVRVGADGLLYAFTFNTGVVTSNADEVSRWVPSATADPSEGGWEVREIAPVVDAWDVDSDGDVWYRSTTGLYRFDWVTEVSTQVDTYNGPGYSISEFVVCTTGGKVWWGGTRSNVGVFARVVNVTDPGPSSGGDTTILSDVRQQNSVAAIGDNLFVTHDTTLYRISPAGTVAAQAHDDFTPAEDDFRADGGVIRAVLATVEDATLVLFTMIDGASVGSNRTTVAGVVEIDPVTLDQTVRYVGDFELDEAFPLPFSDRDTGNQAEQVRATAASGIAVHVFWFGEESLARFVVPAP